MLRRGDHIFGCDLMLFDNVFQLLLAEPAAPRGCDLMLFDNVFQSGSFHEGDGHVVI